jgi:hypothetical protein
VLASASAEPALRAAPGSEVLPAALSNAPAANADEHVSPIAANAAVSAAHEPSIVVDASMAQHVTVSTVPGEGSAQPPRDRADFEAFMRARVIDPTAARHLSWHGQDMSIGHEVLAVDAAEAEREERRSRRNGIVFLVVLGLLVVGGITAYVIDSSADVIRVQEEHSSQAAPALGAKAQLAKAAPRAPVVHEGPTTLISTQPPGAEVLLGGAVLGNTPVEVERPSADELFLVRLTGYEPQLVRLTPGSRDAIHVTLAPLAKGAAAPAAAAAPAPSKP